MSFLEYFLHTAESRVTAKQWAYAEVLQDTSELCGKFVVTFDPLTGLPKRNIWRCKDWRNCENCAKVRSFEVAQRITEFMADKNIEQIAMRHLDDKEYQKLLRKVGKNELIRFPNEECNIVVTSDLQPADIVLSEDDFKNVDFLADLANTPEGKRISGWTKKEPEEPEEDLVDVYVREYMTDNPIDAKNLAEDAFNETQYIPERMALVWDRLPTNEEKKAQVQWALDERENRMVQLAKERGIMLYQRGWSNHHKINITKVNWFQELTYTELIKS